MADVGMIYCENVTSCGEFWSENGMHLAGKCQKIASFGAKRPDLEAQMASSVQNVGFLRQKWRILAKNAGFWSKMACIWRENDNPNKFLSPICAKSPKFLFVEDPHPLQDAGKVPPLSDLLKRRKSLKEFFGFFPIFSSRQSEYSYNMSGGKRKSISTEAIWGD